MPLLNYTTSIKASRTISQIMEILSVAGAREITISYNDTPPLAEALTFVMDVNDRPVPFRLECRWRAIQHILENDKRVTGKKLRTAEHALNVGWRIIKVWVDAQMALIEADLANLPQLFLPHAVGPDGRTLYEHVFEGYLLEPGNAETNPA